MPIKKPPTHMSLADLDKLISKGGQVSNETELREWKHVCVRISSNMLNDVDEALKKRVGIHRTGWILEAIHEKLQKENSND